MENAAQIANILQKAGYDVVYQGGDLFITDPTCIWPPLLEFIDVAWVVLTVITGILLAGWAATMLRGANHDMVKNLRTLVLIFGTLSVSIPAMNMLGGKHAIVSKCDKIEISPEQINELLKLRNQTRSDSDYESFEIIDSEFDDMDDDFNF